MNREFAAVGARRLQQVADHRLELLDVAQRDFEIFPLVGVQFAGNSVQQNRHELIHRRQRRAQFVGHVGEQLVFHH